MPRVPAGKKPGSGQKYPNLEKMPTIRRGGPKRPLKTVGPTRLGPSRGGPRMGYFSGAGSKASPARTMAGAMTKGAQMRGARGAGRGAASRQAIRGAVKRAR